MGTFEHGSDRPEGMIDAEAKVLSIAPASEATAEPAEGDGEYVIKLALEGAPGPRAGGGEGGGEDVITPARGGRGGGARECSRPPDQIPPGGDTVRVRVPTPAPSLLDLASARAGPRGGGGWGRGGGC